MSNKFLIVFVAISVLSNAMMLFGVWCEKVRGTPLEESWWIPISVGIAVCGAATVIAKYADRKES